MAIQITKYNKATSFAEIGDQQRTASFGQFAGVHFASRTAKQFPMKLSQNKAVLSTASLALVLCSVALVLTRARSRQRSDRAAVERPGKLPSVILWAWERPTDLRFIDPKQVGVAFLARTVFLRENEVVVRPRFQTLNVPDNTTMIAVVRIESEHGARAPSLSEPQRHALTDAIAELAAQPSLSALQIDFDAIRSERSFYRELIGDVRKRLPDNVGLSITALASWCADDDWLSDLPIDEAVPMLFRMGPDGKPILNRLQAGEQFPAGPCQSSYGISTDEPVHGLLRSKRLYVFNPSAWTEDSVRAIQDSTK